MRRCALRERPGGSRKTHLRYHTRASSDKARAAVHLKRTVVDGNVAQTLWQRFVRPKVGSDDLSERELTLIASSLAASVESSGGDESTRKRFAALAERYRSLSPEARRRVLREIAAFDVAEAPIAALTAEYAAATDQPERAALRRRLRKALEPPRVTLLRRFNAVPGGVKFLVDLRADLLAADDDPLLAELEADLKGLLLTWFDYGFLELRRITWDAPASLLERLGTYEAVHEMRGWSDLKNRLDLDRRCYAFFHPAMPAEPLIFIEVALTSELSTSVAPLLDPRAPAGNPSEASVAVFYSISNCQRGLDGISFGNALIKRVVGEIASALPNVKRFGTLSPLPGFRAWLRRAYANDASTSLLLAALDRRGWQRDAELTAALREPLLKLCAHYLLEARHPNGRALDPVAHFHLSNGASIERINWLGDASRRGLTESAGLMVNYLYRLDRIEANQVAYRAGRIEASSGVIHLQEPGNRLVPAGARSALGMRG